MKWSVSRRKEKQGSHLVIYRIWRHVKDKEREQSASLRIATRLSGPVPDQTLTCCLDSGQRPDSQSPIPAHEIWGVHHAWCQKAPTCFLPDRYSRDSADWTCQRSHVVPREKSFSLTLLKPAKCKNFLVPGQKHRVSGEKHPHFIKILHVDFLSPVCIDLRSILASELRPHRLHGPLQKYFTSTWETSLGKWKIPDIPRAESYTFSQRKMRG